MKMTSIFMIVFTFAFSFTLIFNVLNFFSAARKAVSFSRRNSWNQNVGDDFAHEMLQRQMQEQEQQMHQDQMRFFQEEAMRSVTPFEHGGYDMTQGNSFNDMTMNQF